MRLSLREVNQGQAKPGQGQARKGTARYESEGGGSAGWVLCCAVQLWVGSTGCRRSAPLLLGFVQQDECCAAAVVSQVERWAADRKPKRKPISVAALLDSQGGAGGRRWSGHLWWRVDFGAARELTGQSGLPRTVSQGKLSVST